MWSDKQLGGALGNVKNIDLASDGRRIVALMPAAEAKGAQVAQNHVVFLLNFFDELRRKVPLGAKWRYSLSMATVEKAVRKSVALPLRTAKRVSALAKSEHTSANRVLVGLIEAGLQSREAEKQHYYRLGRKAGERYRSRGTSAAQAGTSPVDLRRVGGCRRSSGRACRRPSGTICLNARPSARSPEKISTGSSSGGSRNRMLHKAGGAAASVKLG